MGYTLLNTPDQPWGPWRLNTFGWGHSIYPYVKNVQVFKCPSTYNPFGWNYANNSEATGQLNYCANQRLVRRQGDGVLANWDGPPLSNAALSWPATTIMISESTGYASGESVCSEQDEWGWTGIHGFIQANGQPAGGSRLSPEYGMVPPLKRHNDGSNFAFADGHVKFYPWSRTLVVNGPGQSNPTMVNGVQQRRSGQTMTYWPN